MKIGNLTVRFLLVGVVLLSSIHGCYTTLMHPPVPDDEWGAVRMTDDCSECHGESRDRQAVLPSAAEDDESWRFFSSSPWWQDEPAPSALSAEPPETTGPRSFGGTATYEAPAVVPYVAPAVQTLGKSSAEENNGDQQQSTDDRRSFDRRSDTRSEPSPSSDSDASRSRRK